MNHMKKISKRKILLSNICKRYIIIKKDNDDNVIWRSLKGKLIISYDKIFLIISGKNGGYNGV